MTLYTKTDDTFEHPVNNRKYTVYLNKNAKYIRMKNKSNTMEYVRISTLKKGSTKKVIKKRGGGPNTTNTPPVNEQRKLTDDYKHAHLFNFFKNKKKQPKDCKNFGCRTKMGMGSIDPTIFNGVNSWYPGFLTQSRFIKNDWDKLQDIYEEGKKLVNEAMTQFKKENKLTFKVTILSVQTYNKTSGTAKGKLRLEIVKYHKREMRL